MDDLFLLPFETIREPLDNLLAATANLIERDIDTAALNSFPPTRDILLATVRLSTNTYKSIQFLVADTELSARKLEYALSVPPLTRTILDSLFTVVFLLQDLDAHSRMYVQGGFRETFEERSRYAEKHENDEKWRSWLDRYSVALDQVGKDADLSGDQLADPSTVPYWPTPGQMVKGKLLDTDRRDFLEYLTDWYYRALSSDSHLSFPGLIRRAGPLMIKDYDEERLREYKSFVFTTALILILSLVSELVASLGLASLDGRTRYLWVVFSSLTDDAKDLYEYRYQSLLAT